ncbi:MAG: metal ABC transporter permease [Acidiphilium sp.]
MFAGFMLNTWIAATIVAVAAGAVGFFVVLRGAAFAAHTLPLSAFPGAAAAALLGIDPFVGMAGFAIIGIVSIAALGRRGHPEIATALTLVALLALGTLFLSRTGSYDNSVYALLFGQILGIGTGELVPLAIAGALATAAILVLFRPLLLSTISPDLAAARGTAPARIELCFLAIIAAAAVAALPVVGALLVFSLMTGPAACARALAKHPGPALALSIALALAIAWAAIALAYLTDWPVGTFVGGLGALAYAGGRMVRR